MEVLIGTFVILQKFCETNIIPELVSHDVTYMHPASNLNIGHLEKCRILQNGIKLNKKKVFMQFGSCLCILWKIFIPHKCRNSKWRSHACRYRIWRLLLSSHTNILHYKSLFHCFIIIVNCCSIVSLNNWMAFILKIIRHRGWLPFQNLDLTLKWVCIVHLFIIFNVALSICRHNTIFTYKFCPVISFY